MDLFDAKRWQSSEIEGKMWQAVFSLIFLVYFHIVIIVIFNFPFFVLTSQGRISSKLIQEAKGLIKDLKCSHDSHRLTV